MFANKKLEDLGVSPKRALEIMSKRVDAGAFDFDISEGVSVPKVLSRSISDSGRKATLLHSPSGDGERVWVHVEMSSRVTPHGLGYDVVAHRRGPYEGMVLSAKIGEIDADMLFQPLPDSGA